MFASEETIEVSHLPLEVRGGTSAASARVPPARRTDAASDEATCARSVALLIAHRGNLQAVADALRTSRSQIHRWLQRFGVDRTTIAADGV